MSFIPSLIGGIGSIVGGAIRSDANSDAADTQSAGLRRAAATLNQGYDQQLANDLSTLGNLGDLNKARYTATSQGGQALPPQMQQRLAASAQQYGTSIDEMWNRLAGVLRPAAQHYGQAVQGDAGTYADALRQSAQGYGGALAGNAASFMGRGISAARDYGDTAGSVAGSYAGGLGTAGDRFAGQLGGAANAYAGGLNSAVGQLYSPYAAAGAGALQQIRAIAARDPSQLTPVQQQALADYQREMRGNLAASGLSGAGMAGLAAFNRGDAEMRAQLLQQNQARSDQALYNLEGSGLTGTGAMAGAASQGLGAGLQAAQTGAQAQLGQANTGLGAVYNTGQNSAQTLLGAINTGLAATRNAGDSGAAAAYQAGQTGAGAIRQAGDTAAQAGLSAENTLGSTGYQGGAAAATNSFNNANAASNYAGQIGQIGVQNLDNYYRNLGNLTAAQGTATDTNIMGKAQTTANAQQGVANTQARATSANGQLWGSAIGSLGGITAASLKQQG